MVAAAAGVVVAVAKPIVELSTVCCGEGARAFFMTQQELACCRQIQLHAVALDAGLVLVIEMGVWDVHHSRLQGRGGAPHM